MADCSFHQSSASIASSTMMAVRRLKSEDSSASKVSRAWRASRQCNPNCCDSASASCKVAMSPLVTASVKRRLQDSATCPSSQDSRCSSDSVEEAGELGSESDPELPDGEAASSGMQGRGG